MATNIRFSVGTGVGIEDGAELIVGAGLCVGLLVGTRLSVGTGLIVGAGLGSGVGLGVGVQGLLVQTYILSYPQPVPSATRFHISSDVHRR